MKRKTITLDGELVARVHAIKTSECRKSFTSMVRTLLTEAIAARDAQASLPPAEVTT